MEDEALEVQAEEEEVADEEERDQAATVLSDTMRTRTLAVTISHRLSLPTLQAMEATAREE